MEHGHVAIARCPLWVLGGTSRVMISYLFLMVMIPLGKQKIVFLT